MSLAINGREFAKQEIELNPFADVELSLKFKTPRTTFKLEGQISALGTSDVSKTEGNVIKISKHLRSFVPEEDQNVFTETIPWTPENNAQRDGLSVELILPPRVLLDSFSARPVGPLKAHVLLGGVDTQPAHKLDDFDIIIYTTAGAFREGALPLRSHHIARSFARIGKKVAFIPSQKLDADIEHLSENIDQISSGLFERCLGEMFSSKKRRVFICSSKCDVLSVQAVSLAKLAGHDIVYEVRDDIEGMKQLGFASYYDVSFEKYIAANSDLVFVVSSPLRSKMIAWGIDPDRVFLSPNGIDQECRDFFNSIRAKIRNKNGLKRAVYFGHMFKGRFDLSLVVGLAQTYPDWEFVLYGVGLDDALPGNLQNLSAVGYRTTEEFLYESSNASIGLLPFKPGLMTFALSPLKFPQYLSAGLKVVSSNISDVGGLPLSFSNPENTFNQNFDDAVRHKVGDDDIVAIDRYLQSVRWDDLATEYVRRIETLR